MGSGTTILVLRSGRSALLGSGLGGGSGCGPDLGGLASALAAGWV